MVIFIFQPTDILASVRLRSLMYKLLDVPREDCFLPLSVSLFQSLRLFKRSNHLKRKGLFEKINKKEIDNLGE